MDSEVLDQDGLLETSTQYLSGGNLQKLIVARELEQGTPFLIAPNRRAASTSGPWRRFMASAQAARRGHGNFARIVGINGNLETVRPHSGYV